MKNEKWKSASECIKECAAELLSTYDLVKLILFSGALFSGTFILDYLDIPSRIVQQLPSLILYVLIAVLLIVFIVWLIGLHIFDLFRIISVNPIDAASIVLFIATLAYFPVRALTLGCGVYTIVAFSLCATCLLVLILRFVLRCIKLYQFNNKKSNLVDLKDLFEDHFMCAPGKPILLLEKDVDYDLLDRGGITNQLYRSITHCQPYKSYVISLEGEWGIGKTTIINNTKRMLQESSSSTKEYICIDDFDPWLYGTQEALLMAMLESLVHHSGMHYSPSRFGSIVQGLRETVSNGHWTGNFLQSLFSDPAKNGANVARLRHRISRYLRTNNKNIVFFIDNLDRANDENIMFLFKLIGIVFDLPGIIYVLSFEKERINSILENTHHCDPRFAEKIIQQEIKVPAISEEKAQNLYLTCIENLLKAYGIAANEIEEFVPAARYIVAKTRNVRAFKRMVNSVFPIVFCDDILLKKSDLLAIEAIHFYDPELFYAIYKNPKFFISHDKDPLVALKLGFNKNTFNAEGSDYFKKLFAAHGDAMDLLSTLFPYVKRYKSGTVLESENLFSDPEYAQIAKQSRICSGKYFDLYFSYSTNNYLVVRKSVESMIVSINKIQASSTDEDLQETAKVVQKYLFALKKEDHKEWIERLQNHITDIESKSLLAVALSLYALIYYVDDKSAGFDFSLSARSRTEYIISILLEKCSEKEFEVFLSLTKHDYRQLQVIHSIHYWMASEKLDQSETRKARANLLATHYAEICNQIIKTNINLFHAENYYPKNAWALYYHYKQNDNIDGFSTYVASFLSSECIYRVLWDVTTTAISDHYMYSITADNLKVFISDDGLTEQLLDQRPPKSEDEEFVFRVYEMFRHGNPDVWGHKGITSPIAKEPQL